MRTPRRQFLKTTILASLTAAVPLEWPNDASAQQASGTTNIPDQARVLRPDPFDAVSLLNRSSFEPLVESDFLIERSASSASLKLTLIEIRDLAQTGADKAPAGCSEGCFSLLFRGNDKYSLKQGTYLVEHPWLGSFALFLVPMKKNASGSTYEAVFNRADQ